MTLGFPARQRLGVQIRLEEDRGGGGIAHAAPLGPRHAGALHQPIRFDACEALVASQDGDGARRCERFAEALRSQRLFAERAIEGDGNPDKEGVSLMRGREAEHLRDVLGLGPALVYEQRCGDDASRIADGEPDAFVADVQREDSHRISIASEW